MLKIRKILIKIISRAEPQLKSPSVHFWYRFTWRRATKRVSVLNQISLCKAYVSYIKIDLDKTRFHHRFVLFREIIYVYFNITKPINILTVKAGDIQLPLALWRKKTVNLISRFSYLITISIVSDMFVGIWWNVVFGWCLFL